ncbi:MAG TPA: hypothetical protein ENN12_01905 [Epsilonproteobacteria bacterium]|nr:hypothetical protein [Campylobacterota bacterium]
MAKSFFNSQDYLKLMHTHITNMIELLLKDDIEFGIACDVSNISFNPKLPTNISDTFGKKIFFILTDYSHESANIKENVLFFEAGFGDENFGSVVSIPLLAIEQIIVEDNPILINLAPYHPTTLFKEKNSTNSMDALLKNPKNKNLLNKKRHF